VLKVRVIPTLLWKQFGLVKISPLANWTKKEVWKLITDHDIPYNPLHDQGYTSIGCWPCTRAVLFGEDERAGRWSGFKKTELAVTLDVNSKMDVGQIKLEVGNVTEAVSVDAAASALVTSNTMEKAFLVDRTQIAELPMNGRNWVSLMSTVPGMSSSARNPSAS